mgnify:CR=1 FL=1
MEIFLNEQLEPMINVNLSYLRKFATYQIFINRVRKPGYNHPLIASANKTIIADNSTNTFEYQEIPKGTEEFLKLQFKINELFNDENFKID